MPLSVEFRNKLTNLFPRYVWCFPSIINSDQQDLVNIRVIKKSSLVIF